MAGGLEEPILSTLGKESQAPELFMNAFFKASQINNQKQHLEQTLREMQANETWKRMNYDLDKQKFAFDSAYKMKELSRQYDADAALNASRDRTADRLESQFTSKLDMHDAEEEQAGQLRADAAKLISEYPETFSNQEFANKYSILMSDYHTVTTTKAGSRALSDINRNIVNARTSAHQTAADLRLALDSTLSGMERGGQGLDKADLNRPEDAFRHKDGKVMIYEKPIMVPGTTNVGQWATIPPDEASKLGDAELKAQGVRVRSAPENSWKSVKDLHSRMLRIGGSDISERPAPITQGVGGQDLSSYEGKVINQGGQRYKVQNGQAIPLP